MTIKSLKPKNRDELKELIHQEINDKGERCSLNHIDTSLITSMNGLFIKSRFNGDISTWNTSNVEDMGFMFAASEFNGDISKWNTSKVTGMIFMFNASKFNKDLGKWNVSQVKDMSDMFGGSIFNGDLSGWDVGNVVNMSEMFYDSKFNQNIDSWCPYKIKNIQNMFDKCPITLPVWYNEDEQKIKKYLNMRRKINKEKNELNSKVQKIIVIKNGDGETFKI